MTRFSLPLTYMAQSYLFKFIVVGGVGFVTDGGLLLILNNLFGVDPLWARAVGFPAAVTVTWLLNRAWTFADTANKISHKRYGLYLGVQGVGAALNFGVFAALVFVFPFFVAYPILALAIGASISLMFTFSASKYAVFMVRH